MKKLILSFTLLLSFVSLNSQTTPVIATGLSDPGSVLVVGNDLYITETGPQQRLIKVNLNDPMPATPTVVLTGLNKPMGLAHQGDYLYFVQYGNGVLSRIDLTQANPVREDLVVAGLTNPSDIAINGNDLYVAASGNNQIVKVDLNSSFPTFPTIIQGVPAPWGLAIYGNLLLISTTGTANILSIDMTQGINPLVNPVSTAGMQRPKGMTIDGDILFIADELGNKILQLDLTQSYPAIPTPVTNVTNPQDVIQNVYDLIVSEIATDEVIRVANPVAVNNYVANNPGTDVYTGHADSTMEAGSNNPMSWSSGTVPGIGQNLVFLPGIGGEISHNMSVNSITALDNSFINIFNNVKIASLSQFGVNSIINWVGGTLSGNALLNNRGQINCTTYNMGLSDSITLANYGGIRFETVGDLTITNATLHNTPSGEIKFDYRDTDIRKHTFSTRDTFINEGLITKKVGGTTVISAELHNTGIIEIDSGTLELQNRHNLNNGTFLIVKSGTTLLGLYYSDFTLSGTISGVLDGDFILAGADLEVPTSATLDFSGSQPMQWTGTDISGGGVLNLKSNVSIFGVHTGFVYIRVLDGTTINNEAVFTLTSSMQCYLQPGFFNNMATGVIDLQSTGSFYFTSQPNVPLLTNYGLIKKSLDPSSILFRARVHNQGGTIQVQKGELQFDNPGNYFSDGTYNVDLVDNKLNIVDGNFVGNLTGNLDGTLGLINNVKVDSATTATLDFSGSGAINCNNCIVRGEGTFVNKSKLDVVNSSFYMTIDDGATFNNEGYISLKEGLDLYVEDGTFNNLMLGTIDLQSDGANISYGIFDFNILNNTGLIKKSTTGGTSTVSIECNNMGEIQVDSGTLQFTRTLHNHSNGTMKGIANIDLPAAGLYTNEGLYAPGASPGKLNVIGDYESTSSAVLDIELNGLDQETEYDLLTVQGDADVNGIIELSLGFQPAIGDTFAIMTSTGALTSTLSSTLAGTSPNNDIYTFDVQVNANSIVLKVVADCQAIRSIQNITASGTYKAGTDIIAMDLVIDAPTVFSAPNVALSSDFEVPIGKLFEIIQDGCGN